MAAGDVKSDLQTITNGGILTIQPPPGEEWVIHNIYYTGAVGFRIYKGSTYLQFDTDSAGGARLGLVTHVTNAQYLHIINNSGSSINIAYDGVQTK